MLVAGGMYTPHVWETTRQLSQQIKLSTKARAQVASMSRELHHSALTKELLLGIEDEAFIQSLQKRSAEIDTQYEEEMKKAMNSERELLFRQRQILWGWVLGFALITVLVVFFSVVLSRRIASPMQTIQQTLEAVSRGKLQKEPKDLRASGEFRNLNDSLCEMIGNLRLQKEQMLSELKVFIVELESPTPRKGVEGLRRLVKALEAQLKEDV
jgi:nitrogen fixation/metabolism regulation signal transduction histidine kinase